MACEDWNSVQQTAANLLREHLGQEARLHRPCLLKDGLRCRVVRCAVNAPETGITSVIVKQIKPVPERDRGFTDWASLAFLSSLGHRAESPRGAGLPPGAGEASHTGSSSAAEGRRPTSAGREPGATESVKSGQAHGEAIAPRFYGGDVDAGVYAIEDLGGSATLDDLLNGRERIAAQNALETLAIQAARLHSVTLGREVDFERLRATLPGARSVDRQRDTEQWLAGRTHLEAWFDAVGCTVPPGFDAAFARVADVYRTPGPFLAFTHGDFAPSNNHVAGAEVRLLDFEFGGYRHALYDMTVWDTLCPLPDPVAEAMSRCYRAELGRGCPDARDDTHYRAEWALMCAYRTLAMLTWIRPAILERNRPWVGDWSAREAVLAALGRLQCLAVRAGELEPITEAAGALEGKLRSRWPEYGEVLPRWPALAANG